MLQSQRPTHGQKFVSMAAGSIPAAPEIPPIVANRTRIPIEDVVAALKLLPLFIRRKHAAADITEAMFYSCCHTNTDCTTCTHCSTLPVLTVLGYRYFGRFGRKIRPLTAKIFDSYRFKNNLKFSRIVLRRTAFVVYCK